MSRSVTLVVNPSSGKGRAQALLPQVAGRLRDGGLDVAILLSRDAAEAEAMARAAAVSGVDVVAVMGGDGMMHLGVNACAGHAPILGLIPAGTGNDLCRGLGLDPADPVSAAGVIVAGTARDLDLIRVNQRYVGTVVCAGFDSMVNHRANAMPWPKGKLRYPMAALAELRVFSPLEYRLTIDGEVRDLHAMVVAVGNTPSYGGGMQICPGADPYDGRLDITIIHPVGRVKLLRLLPQIYTGKFARDPAVERLQATSILIEGPGLVGYGDGEMIAASPLALQCLPGAVRVAVAP